MGIAQDRAKRELDKEYSKLMKAARSKSIHAAEHAAEHYEHTASAAIRKGSAVPSVSASAAVREGLSEGSVQLSPRRVVMWRPDFRKLAA